MIYDIVNIVGPILVVTCIGYLLGRSREDLHIDSMGKIIIMIATPALIFSALTTLDISIEMLSKIAFSAMLCVGISAMLGLALIRAFGLPARSCLPSLMLPNSGNIGLPLAYLAFGQPGLTLGVSYFFVIALIQHSAGYAIASGTVRFTFLLRQPLIYAVAGVLLVVATGVTVPPILQSTTEILGGMMIPGMLIMLGNALGTLKISDLRPAIVLAVGRLAIGVLSAFVVIALLDLSGITAGLVFLMATMPSAVVTYVYAQRFSEDAGQVAGAVLASTLLTFACLPALLWVALSLTEQNA